MIQLYYTQDKWTRYKNQAKLYLLSTNKGIKDMSGITTVPQYSSKTIKSSQVTFSYSLYSTTCNIK